MNERNRPWSYLFTMHTKRILQANSMLICAREDHLTINDTGLSLSRGNRSALHQRCMCMRCVIRTQYCVYVQFINAKYQTCRISVKCQSMFSTTAVITNFYRLGAPLSSNHHHVYTSTDLGPHPASHHYHTMERGKNTNTHNITQIICSETNFRWKKQRKIYPRKHMGRK